MLKAIKVDVVMKDFITDIFDKGCPAAVIEDKDISFIIRNKSGNADEAALYSSIKIVRQGDIVHNYVFPVDSNKFDKIVNELRKSKRIVDVTNLFLQINFN